MILQKQTKKKMGDFVTKFDRVFSELQISKTCNSLSCKQIIDLEQSSLDNAKYFSPILLEASNNKLEGLVC